MSMDRHPDRNPDENADEQFRKLAAIYEVLKTTDLRKKYDDILENGLPDWKQPLFYYRRARKLSWFEALLIIGIICTVGHYFMLWGAYIDRYWTLSSNRSRLRKKEVRQLKKTGTDAELLYEAEIAEMLADLWPSWQNLLPLLLIDHLGRIVAATNELGEGPTRRYTATPQPVFEYSVASDVKPVSTCVFDNTNRIKSNTASDSKLLITKY
ncbi:unnamed protein product [Gongylonema pulchrum]|uniref:J domain-containing protein n=1 Tax=Gongylonema pulchrum TaxID=637853 RepID=A0A183EV71_9BILA|nr:unnamed protein product [Gongylonema pulchrum]